MKKILFILNHVIWKILNLTKKIYWYSWRKEQIFSFKKCGKNVYISKHCFFTNHTISIGNDVFIGQRCRFQSTKSNIYIGNHVMFGPGVSIHGGNHRIDVVGKYMKDITLSEKLPENDQDVIIGDDVWIGANAIILKGVTIGEGSVVGSGSVISKDIPPYTIIVGSKSQKSFNRWSDDTIKEHISLIRKKNNGK